MPLAKWRGALNYNGSWKAGEQLAVKADDLEFLKENLPFWNKLTELQQQQLEVGASLRSYAKGTMMYSGSSDCSGLFLLKSGQIRTFIISETGKEITLYRLFEGDICIFSASCVMHNISFIMQIEAEKDTTALIIAPDIYKQLIQSSLSAADYFNQLIAARFSDVMWIMEQVLFMSFDKRLALFLLDESNIEGTDSLTITHESIARHLGSAREVVTRMLKYFQTEAMVSLSRGLITIIDRKKLEKLL